MVGKRVSDHEGKVAECEMIRGEGEGSSRTRRGGSGARGHRGLDRSGRDRSRSSRTGSWTGGYRGRQLGGKAIGDSAL